MLGTIMNFLCILRTVPTGLQLLPLGWVLNISLTIKQGNSLFSFFLCHVEHLAAFLANTYQWMPVLALAFPQKYHLPIYRNNQMYFQTGPNPIIGRPSPFPPLGINKLNEHSIASRC